MDDASDRRCTACGAAPVPHARFCVHCGDTLRYASEDGASGRSIPTTGARASPCRGCDLEGPTDRAFCPRCGTDRPGVARRRLGDAPPSRPEGWFPDPFGRSASRWWDGHGWTAYVADGAVHWDPVSFAPEAQPGVRGIGIAMIGFAVGIAIGFPAAFAMHESGEPGGRAALLVVSALTLWAGLGGALAYVTMVRGTRSLVGDFGLRFRWVDLPLGIAGWIAGRILGAVMVLPIIAVWPDLRPDEQGIYGDGTITTAEWIVLAVIVCIGAPLVEELFFRGLVQTRLVDRYGAVVGIGVTSVLFGAAHLIGWVGPITFVFATAITGAGIVLGILRHVTGRLGAPIVAHVLFNAQALVVVALLQ